MSTSPVAGAAAFAPTPHRWGTAASVGIVACLLADMVHEALGHCTAAWLAGDRILSLSTVGVQSATANRFVAAAGTTANCAVGVVSLLLYSRSKKLTPSALFLWLFGAFNLFNSGYLVVSALLNSGDWAGVIAGRSPSWLWRCLLGLTGACLYGFSVRWAAGSMIRTVENGSISVPDLRRHILTAYVAGASVMTIASIFNPIGPGLILMSGAGASFGLNSGILFASALIAGNVRAQFPVTDPIRLTRFWIGLALVVGGLFVFVVGPGIRFPG